MFSFTTEEELVIALFVVLLVSVAASIATPAFIGNGGNEDNGDNESRLQRLRSMSYLDGGATFVALLLSIALFGSFKAATDDLNLPKATGPITDYGWVKDDDTTAIPTLDSLFDGYTDTDRTVYVKSLIERAVNRQYVKVSSIFQMEHNPIAGKYSYTAKFNEGDCTYRVYGEVVVTTTIELTEHYGYTSNWSSAIASFRFTGQAEQVGC